METGFFTQLPGGGLGGCLAGDNGPACVFPAVGADDFFRRPAGDEDAFQPAVEGPDANDGVVAPLGKGIAAAVEFTGGAAGGVE